MRKLHILNHKIMKTKSAFEIDKESKILKKII